MKTRILTYILTGVVGMMAIIFSGSCDDSDLVRRVNPNIQIQEELFVAPIASRQVLNLRSSYPWYAEASDGWIKLLRCRGQALLPDSIVAMLDDNPNMEAREGWIEVRLMDQLSQRIVVKQNGRGSLITLSKSLIYFNVNGGETTLDVFTNVEWDTDIQTVDGLTFIKVDKNHLKVKVGKNTTGAERRKTVTLTSSENKEVKAQLEVVQTNVEKMLSISLSDEEKDMVTMKTGGEVQIPVSLNVKYECVASDNSWIKFTDIPEFSGDIVQDIIVKATVEPNATKEERNGYIVVKDPVDVKVTDTLYISQRGVSRIVYVKAGSAGDGSSWENAYGSVADGMAACDNDGDMELWVARGGYQLTASLNKKAINAYGGFNGTEKKVKDRPAGSKATLIGGNFKMITAWNAPEYGWYYMDGFILTGVNSKNTDVGALEIYRHHAFRNCIIHSNVYGKNSGGYFENTRLVNCLFYNNVTQNAAPIQISNTELYNVTFVNNKGEGWASSGGIRTTGAKCSFYNTVVWGNQHDRAPGNNFTQVQIRIDAAENHFVNCAVEGGYVFNDGKTPTSMTGCITLDKNNMNAEGPNFTDVSGANYQLLKTSPLIDAGSNAAIGGLNLLDDILYGERIWGSTVDIGAFEFRIEK